MSKLQVRVDESTYTPIPVIKTGCCGATLYQQLNPTICPVCGQSIGPVTIAQEPTFNSAKFNGTRYWS